MCDYILNDISTDSDFTKIIYEYLIQTDAITGRQLCLILFDQNILAFDEDDIAGLSGGTIAPASFIKEKIQNLEITPAQLVAEKLNTLSKTHQIICITHLPQIAAMADNHYVIEKSTKDNRTISNITKLSYDESIGELARMLGGSSITDAVVSNAKELKNMAQTAKNN